MNDSINRTPKIGIIGTGYWGENLLPTHNPVCYPPFVIRIKRSLIIFKKEYPDVNVRLSGLGLDGRQSGKTDRLGLPVRRKTSRNINMPGLRQALQVIEIRPASRLDRGRPFG